MWYMYEVLLHKTSYVLLLKSVNNFQHCNWYYSRYSATFVDAISKISTDNCSSGPLIEIKYSSWWILYSQNLSQKLFCTTVQWGKVWVFTRDARPAKSRPCPAPPREIDKTRGAQRGKTDCRFHWWPLFITPTNYALEEERVGKYFHLTLWTDCDYLVHRNTFLKWKDKMFSFIKTS